MDIKQFGLTASLIEAAKKCMSKEELTGGQKKIDVNKNGKLDKEDFKKLRGEAKIDKDEEDDVESATHEKKEKKKEMKADEGYVSHAQRKAVWASRNDAKESVTTDKEEIKQLDEISSATKASYVAKAKDQIKQSVPFTNKGDEYRALARNFIKKREKGIAKANEAKDPREYGYEGDMALNQLATLIRCGEMIKDMLKPDTDMPEWVQSKITLATDYIQTAADYMYSEMKESKEVGDENSPNLSGSVMEAASAAVRMHRALEKIKQSREASERRAQELLNPKKPEPVKEALDPSEVAGNPKMYDSSTVKKAYYHKSVNASDKESLAKHLDRHHGNKEWRKSVKESFRPMDEPNYNNSIQARQAAADKSSAALSGLVAKKNLKQAEGKKKSQEFINKMVSRVNAAKRIGEGQHNKSNPKNKEVKLDEVSTDGYHAAAINSRKDNILKLMTSMGADKTAKIKVDARNAGLKRLSDRTSAEMKKANSGPQKPTMPSKPPTEAELRGYGKGRYMGDSVEVTDNQISDIPFDGPYSKKKSAIPGKYGIGPSTAKHLARMAMNKQIVKAKKESNK